MSTSTSSNKIIDSSLKKKVDKNLLKSSSASIVQKSNYDNYLYKITSFQNKTRNKNNNSNFKLSSTEIEQKNSKNNIILYNNPNNILGNQKLANNISFKIINHSSKNSCNINKKFVKTLYQRKKFGEIIKVNTNNTSKITSNTKNTSNNKLYNSEKLTKNNKKFNNKITTSYNNCTTSTQNEILTSERDLEGPEIIHFSLVELIQKGNKKMNDLANQFEN